MSPTSPTWLTERGGSLKPGSDGARWFVMIGDQPAYSLQVVPAEGKFGCVIRETNSGQRIASSALAATPAEALQSGLEDLRKNLGWG
jgi:hypothetical protein